MTSRSRFPLRAMAAAALSALLAGCIFDQANRGTIVDNEVRVGTLYLADGKPAANARVRVYAVDHQPDTSAASGEPAFATRTDADGKYSVDVDKGEYNILGEKDGAFSYQDSVFFGESPQAILPDTLYHPGSVAGVVGMQPNHNPISCLVQVLGTNVYSNVDTGGRFLLTNLAEGRYTLRIFTTLPDYTARIATIRVVSGRKDTLPDTLHLPYTGIPVVTGLKAVYDTAEAVVSLTWDPVQYREFSEYMIYRDEKDVLVPTNQALGSTTLNSFADTLLQRGGGFGPADTHDLRLEYRIKVRNKSDDIGLSYGKVPVHAVGPGKLRIQDSLRLVSQAWDPSKQAERLAFSAELASPVRGLKSVRWSVGPDDSLLKERSLAGAKRATDEVSFDWAAEGSFTVRIRTEDMAGDIVRDSLRMPGNSAPARRAMLPEYVLTASDFESLLDLSVTDPDGDSLRYSLKNQPWWLSVTADGKLRSAATNAEAGSHPGIVLTVSDGRRTINLGPFAIKVVTVPWETLEQVPRGTGAGRGVVLGARVYMIGATTRATEALDIYTPSTGTWVEGPAMPEIISQFTMQASGGSIYVFGGGLVLGKFDYNTTVWAYDTLTRIWSKKKPMPTNRLSPSSAVVNGKIYVMGGLDSANRQSLAVEEYNPATDTWTIKKDIPVLAGTPRMGVYGGLAGLNGRIYAYGFTYPPDFIHGHTQAMVAYDPAAETWTNLKPSSVGRIQSSVGILGGKIYAAGGYAGEDLTLVEAYDPGTDSWTTKAPMPRALSGAAPAVVGNMLYLIQGFRNATFHNGIYRYDPALDP